MPESKRQKLVATSLRFGENLWFEFRKRALEEHRTATEILEGLMAGYLKRSAPIPENYGDNSLTRNDNSVIISVRAEEKEWAEKLVAILRGGDVSAAKEIKHELSLFFGNIEAEVHGSEVGTSSGEVPGEPGGDTGQHGVVVPTVRKRTVQIERNKP